MSKRSNKSTVQLVNSICLCENNGCTTLRYANPLVLLHNSLSVMLSSSLHPALFFDAFLAYSNPNIPIATPAAAPCQIAGVTMAPAAYGLVTVTVLVAC